MPECHQHPPGCTPDGVHCGALGKQGGTGGRPVRRHGPWAAAGASTPRRGPIGRPAGRSSPPAAQVAEALALVRSHKPTAVVEIRDPLLSAAGPRTGDMEYEELLARGDPNFAWRTPDDEWDTIAVNYTSGTTGHPKGVLLHHRGATLNSLNNVLTWGMPKAPTYLWTLPMFHCNGWCFPWTIVALGGQQVRRRRRRRPADALIRGADDAGLPAPRRCAGHLREHRAARRHAPVRRSGRCRVAAERTRGTIVDGAAAAPAALHDGRRTAADRAAGRGGSVRAGRSPARMPPDRRPAADRADAASTSRIRTA